MSRRLSFGLERWHKYVLAGFAMFVSLVLVVAIIRGIVAVDR